MKRNNRLSLDPLQDDDDYSQASSTSSLEDIDEPTQQIDPLTQALDDLESRAISALNEFKEHSGTRTGQEDIHSELKLVLRPLVEIAAHTGPTIAREKWRQSFRNSIDEALAEVHKRLNEELIYPVLIDVAQSDFLSAKRSAALSFFFGLHKELKSNGSWLDYNELGDRNRKRIAGNLYGNEVVNKMQLRQRMSDKVKREALLLKYWVTGSTACTVPGAFTDVNADGAIASRAVISSSAVIRPALRHVSDRIREADDQGALRLFGPVMKMISGVLKRFFTSQTQGSEKSIDALKSACVKFLEIVVLSFSSRAQPDAGGRRKPVVSSEDFALEDLPMGHPVITRQALEEIGEDAFTVLRGLTLVGGQVKVDAGVVSDVRMSLGLDANGQGSMPNLEIIGILRPAALCYLEVESTLNQKITEDDPFPKVDRADLEIDFSLNQKSYALTINAVSMLATNRPTFFADSTTCLAKRAMDPPTAENSVMSKSAVMSVNSHLRASCLTLLRNALSVTSGSSDILHKALSSDACSMKTQADKALRMARQAASLKTASRKDRNRAALEYTWEGGTNDTTGSKRKRAGEDKLEQMRAAKAARGLGNGIQLPKSMTEACDLILLNLSNLPSSRATAALGDKKSKMQKEQKRSRPFTLDYFIDAIITNGDSLVSDESKWYGRDGGDAWVMDISALISEDEAERDSDDPMTGEGKKNAPIPVSFTLDTKIASAAESFKNGLTNDDAKLYKEQCDSATADAFERILKKARSVRDPSVADFGNQIAARMAWTLKKLEPQHDLKTCSENAIDSAKFVVQKVEDKDFGKKLSLDKLPEFAEAYPLVSSALQFDLETNVQYSTEAENENVIPKPTSSLTQRLLNEAFTCNSDDQEELKRNNEKFEKVLELYICSVLKACEDTNEKPLDNQKKKIASTAASTLSKDLNTLPYMSQKSLELTSLLCDIDGISKKAAEVSRKGSNQNIATAAATNAAKAAAEKRAKSILLALRDAAFQRSKPEARLHAVNCAVGITSGRLPASQSVEDMALKLVMNVLYPKSADLASQVVAAAKQELERAALYAIENNRKINDANEEAMSKRGEQQLNPSQPTSDVEKQALDFVKKPANLFMALCIREPAIIKELMTYGCREGADVLVKSIRNNMPKLARAAAKKYGAAKIALQVAELADKSETPLLLSFLDNLTPANSSPPGEDLIEACISIQNNRLEDGEKDPRFIIPVVSGMTRTDLEKRLPEFIAAEDNVFMSSLFRMSERLNRQALSFREEVQDNPLLGMTLCEQLVYLHNIDFAAAELPQKRYLQSITMCLEQTDIYSDRIVMAALDHMSAVFLQEDSLPLGYMRTVIVTCSKHETLHSWICSELLPRLVQGKIYNDRRQWEGWMRCAKMLESGDGGAGSINAINQLPKEQYETYRSRYPVG